MKKQVFILIFISMFLLTLLSAKEFPFIKLEKISISQTPEDMVIPDLGSVTIDSKGNIFAFAGRNMGSECYVIKFDANLKFVKTFGRHGSGPSEFTMNGSLADDRLTVDPQNNDIIVIDYNPTKFVVFDNDGNYKADIPLTRKYPGIGCLSDIRTVGNNCFISFRYNDAGSSEFLFFTLNPLNVKILHNFHDKMIYLDRNMMQFESDEYGSRCFLDIDSGFCVVGNSQFYRFHVFDGKGNLKLEVHDKTKEKRTFSSKEMEYIEKRDFSHFKDSRNSYIRELYGNRAKFNRLIDMVEESKSVLRGIKIGGEKIYLFLVGDDIAIQDKILAVIYDLKGKIIRRGYFKKIPDKIWKNYAFYFDRDAEDNPVIIKYKILD